MAHLYGYLWQLGKQPASTFLLNDEYRLSHRPMVASALGLLNGVLRSLDSQHTGAYHTSHGKWLSQHSFFHFFLSHSLLLIVALAIPLLLGWRSRGFDDVKSLLFMDLYLACIIPINIWLGTNYGYTQNSPVAGCILDYLGPAPWYYLWLQLPALTIFRLMMLIAHDKNEE